MTGHISVLVKQALCTFSGRNEVLAQNLDKLRSTLAKTTATDIGLTADHPLLRPDIWRKSGKAPVTYIEIYEDNTVSLGVFVLKENMKLPLHDHPHMYGLIKVLHGTLKVHSYSILEDVNESDIHVECHQPVEMDYTDPPCLLEPDKKNLHEIGSVNGIAAFLDILAPPYDVYIPELGVRTCKYFRRIRQTGIDKMLLRKVDCPNWYWSDSFPYSGPPIKPQSENEELQN